MKCTVLYFNGDEKHRNKSKLAYVRLTGFVRSIK